MLADTHDKIGWDNFLRGYISIEFCYVRLMRSIPKVLEGGDSPIHYQNLRKAQQFNTKAITALYEYTVALWAARIVTPSKSNASFEGRFSVLGLFFYPERDPVVASEIRRVTSATVTDPPPACQPR